MGPAPGAESVSEPERVETQRGVLASAEGLFTRPAAVAHGCVCHRGDIARGASACARQTGPWHGIPAVRCDAVTGLLRHPRQRHDPAGVALLAELALEPGATGARFIDTHQRCGRRWPLADEVIDVTRPRPHGAQGAHLRAVLVGDICHSTRLLMDIHAAEKCARLRHG
jgi:hypothetical protein